jgi:hypothetical protein
MSVEACVAENRLLAQDTLDFTRAYNPLFLARPDWMRMATCLSAYGFACGYALVGVAAAFDLWSALRLPLALFMGAKLYAICFYHIMEFTSATPPPVLLPYFAVEGPYFLSIALVVRRLVAVEAPVKVRKD